MQTWFDAMAAASSLRLAGGTPAALPRDVGLIYGLDEPILACIDASIGELQWNGGSHGYGQVPPASGYLITGSGKKTSRGKQSRGKQDLRRPCFPREMPAARLEYEVQAYLDAARLVLLRGDHAEILRRCQAHARIG